MSRLLAQGPRIARASSGISQKSAIQAFDTVVR